MARRQAADAGAGAPTPSGSGNRTPYDLDSLLSVVVDVFNERGYDGTRMDDLSRALGITKGAIYHHVEGKEQLLQLALDRALDRLDGIAADAAALDKPAVEQLEFVVRGSVHVLQQEHSYVALLLRVRNTTPAGQDAITRRRSIDAFVAGLIHEAQRYGDLRADLDPALTSRLLLGMVNSLAEWYQPNVDTSVDAHIADTIVEIALDGLRAHPKKSAAAATSGAASARR
jgi:AcrR family transcriptional regulator